MTSYPAARFAAALALAAVFVLRAGSAAHAANEDLFPAVIAAARPSVVAVGSYSAKDAPSVAYAGTGFVVGDGRTVATNAHVIEAVRRRDRLGQLQVFFPDASPLAGRPATVLAEDRFHDVALLRFEGAAATPLRLDPQSVPEQGSAVGVLGYPIGVQLGLVPAAHKGVIAAVVPAVLPLPRGARLTPELAEAIRRPYDLYQLDLLVFPGNSGSPLVDAIDGRVVGIINKTLASRTREHLLSEPSGISYAVPIRWVNELLIRIESAGSPEAASAVPASSAGE